VASGTLALLRSKIRVTHQRLLALVADLNDEQLAWRPYPTAHSIGFTLWHCARADDNVQADLGGRQTIWARGDRARRWGHPERGVGTGWDDAAAASLPLPAKGELLEYAREIFEAVSREADHIDEAGIEERVQSRFLSGESSRGEILVVCLTHDNRHLGEMEYIKGLQGMRGTVTS
jgi:uncharacterized damage-inducible protein DinB